MVPLQSRCSHYLLVHTHLGQQCKQCAVQITQLEQARALAVSAPVHDASAGNRCHGDTLRSALGARHSAIVSCCWASSSSMCCTCALTLRMTFHVLLCVYRCRAKTSWLGQWKVLNLGSCQVEEAQSRSISLVTCPQGYMPQKHIPRLTCKSSHIHYAQHIPDPCTSPPMCLHCA